MDDKPMHVDETAAWDQPESGTRRDESDCSEEITIQALNNGPFLVKGKIKLMDAKGREILTKGNTVALCRCGHSFNKPFCDGTHQHCDFKA